MAILFFVFVPVGAAGATVLVPLDDPALVGSSDVIVTGTVVGVRSVTRPDGRTVTRTRIAVDLVLKGRVDGATVTMTTPGGRTRDRWVVVFGTPTCRGGEAVLAFLQRNRRGELRPSALALGVYWLTTGPDGSPQAERRRPVRDVRPLATFASTIGALSGAVPEARSTVVVPTPTAELEAFTFLGPPFARWFEPDDGQVVRYKVANADVMLGAAASNAVIDAAFGAWTGVPTATITLTRGGTTTPSSRVGACDGKSTIQFNDPFDDISPLVGCSGVLAIGGFCVGADTKVVNGVQFRRIAEGDLTMANGVGNCLDLAGFEEIVTHEVGHTIGLGHSSENPNEPTPALKSATMYYLAHLDGRGASLRDDDIAGVTALYPDPVDPNDLDGDGVQNAGDACPSTPAGTAVDATGCGCREAGHAACDDGLVCTADACDDATGGCVATTIDCTGGDPCVAGACDEASGCQTTPLTGDAAATCAYGAAFPPGQCVIDSIPRRVGKLFRHAGLTAGRAVPTGDTRLAQRSVRKLDRALATVSRTASHRRRTLSAGCATALTTMLTDARSRLLAWIDQRSGA
ncbi:MAG: matrixin family metalloprotease [Candidatus Binatia bacterium]